MSSGNRRADGSLRPSVRRRRARRNRAARAEWLARFGPGVRDEFFRFADATQAVWLGPFARASGLEQAEAAAALERLAADRRWRKLRTLDGLVVGIAPPRQDAAAPEV